MKQKPEVIDHWFLIIKEEGKGLTTWEEEFIESLTNQWELKRFLSDKQEEILERIYAEKNTMTYYLIRHKKSGEFMPQMKRDRGYSHWNPSTKSIPDLALPVPRLITTRKKAVGIIREWYALPNARIDFTQDYNGLAEHDLVIIKDGRRKEDLEIVEIEIVEKTP